MDENPKQCRGTLSTEPKCYCFEGVVCEAYRREHRDRAYWHRRRGSRKFCLKGKGSTSTAPFCEVRDWATGDGRIYIDGGSLIKHNDGPEFKNFAWLRTKLEEALKETAS